MAAKKIAVIGGGSWGTAVANVLADAGGSVTLWARDANQLAEIEQFRENKKYLKGIRLSDKLRVGKDLERTMEAAEVIFCAIPTQQIRQVFASRAVLLANKLVVNTSKGIEEGTFCRVSEIFHSLQPQATYAIVSGPSFAQETAKRMPTAVTVASVSPDAALAVQQLLATPYFRAYTSADVLGVEIAGGLKNVIAIASGIVLGLQLGYNAQAAIINRGMAEMLRFGKRLGATPLTFLGLAGMGDLILTCTGPLSRNRRVGQLLGENQTLDEIRLSLGGVAEGVFTARAALQWANQLKVEMPITQQVHDILYHQVTPDQALTTLMSRDLREEW